MQDTTMIQLHIYFAISEMNTSVRLYLISRTLLAIIISRYIILWCVAS